MMLTIWMMPVWSLSLNSQANGLIAIRRDRELLSEEQEIKLHLQPVRR